MDTETTASAVIMGETKMAEQEAIFMFETIRKAKRFTNTESTIEAYNLAIQALKNEQKRKEIIEFYKTSKYVPTNDYVKILEECEVSDG